MNNKEEIKRVLDMVESGRISAAEGAALLESAQSFSGIEITCPYCAESISAGSRICPECGSNLAAPVSTPQCAGSGFQSLTGLGKFLVVYTLLVSGQTLLQHFFRFDFASAISVLLSGLGLAAGILILKGRAAGWKLALWWSALQIIPIIIRYLTINEQFFHFGIKNQVNGMGLGLNLIGLILLILFIKAKPLRQQEGD
jgi:hypothetical protein